MRIQRSFSIIEMMTVVFIILLLLSLMTPLFINLKMNARTALCKSQLKQIGSLITSYQTEHGGYLPNDTAITFVNSSGLTIKSDIPTPVKMGYYDYGPNNNLYSNWNGHLLPYIDVNLPEKYTRHAMVTKMGCTRSHDSQLGSGKQNPPPANVLAYGWAVVDDAFRVGGYHDLKVFICPEIHQNTFDVGASIKFNGVRIPRIQQLCTGGITGFGAFSDVAGYDYGMGGGVPTTYLANDRFFGLDNYWAPNNINSYRMDQINDVSQKAFILEGGVADAYGGYSYGNQSNGSMGITYYGIGDSSGYDGGDLSGSLLNKDKPQLHKMSYVHDNYNQFWIMQGAISYTYWPNMWMSRNALLDLVTRFNLQFAPKAYMVEDDRNWSYPSCSLISYVDPEEYGSVFRNFFDTNFPGLVGALRPFIAFTDTPNDFHYATGEANALFGDGSASTKNQAWLYNNRRQIGGLSR